MNNIGVYKMNKSVSDPKIVDNKLELTAHLPAGEMVLAYNNQNKQRTIMSKHIESQKRDCIICDPQDRLMIPTGIIINKTKNATERLFINPEIYWKYGFVLGHDFIEDNKQIYICLLNTSHARVLLENKDVIAYLQLTPTEPVKVTSLKNKPK